MDFQQILITRCQIDLSKPLLAAVSGGPDSLCLADLLNQLHIAVVIAHFDHQLRPSSATEVEMIRSYAERNHNEFTSGSMDVKHFAESQKLSIEEAARKARYTFLFEQAKKYKAQAVVTGHTADDQVETILMHLLRGCGAEGLQGMAFFSSGKVWDSMIPLARPLLNTWRSETIAYCREHQLEPVTDETNSETKYYRNRIRLELIPLLETYNPRFKENLLKTADVIREDHITLKKHLDTLWQKVLINQTAECIILDADDLKKLGTGTLRGIFRKTIRELRPGLRDVDFESIGRAIEFLHHPPSTKYAELLQNIALTNDGKSIIIHEKDSLPFDNVWPQILNEENLKVNVEESAKLGEWSFKITRDSGEGLPRKSELTKDPFLAYVDADMIRLPIEIRTIQEGDRFTPFGMGGHSIKLSDFWINSGLPRRGRKKWPLICSGEDIIWIPGFRISEKVKITPKTRDVFRLSLRKS